MVILDSIISNPQIFPSLSCSSILVAGWWLSYCYIRFLQLWGSQNICTLSQGRTFFMAQETTRYLASWKEFSDTPGQSPLHAIKLGLSQENRDESHPNTCSLRYRNANRLETGYTDLANSTISSAGKESPVCLVYTEWSCEMVISLHKHGAVRTVDRRLLRGRPAGWWLGEYMTLEKAFYYYRPVPLMRSAEFDTKRINTDFNFTATVAVYYSIFTNWYEPAIDTNTGSNKLISETRQTMYV